MTTNTNNNNKNSNKKTIGIVLASSAAVAVLTAGLIFGTAGSSNSRPHLRHCRILHKAVSDSVQAGDDRLC